MEPLDPPHRLRDLFGASMFLFPLGWRDLIHPRLTIA